MGGRGARGSGIRLRQSALSRKLASLRNAPLLLRTLERLCADELPNRPTALGDPSDFAGEVKRQTTETENP